MRKITLLIIAMALCRVLQAQLPNGNFENWTTTTLNTPNGWSGSIVNALNSNIAPNVTQVTPGHSGSFAIKLETVINSTVSVFGYFANCTYNQDPTIGEGGVPYTQKPDSFICYAKLGIQTGDTGLILVLFKQKGTIISYNLWKLTGNTPTTWKRLAFKISTMSVSPDTVIIAAASSNAISGTGMKNGSFIIFDDLQFNTTPAIPNGGFENWTTMNVDDLTGWTTSNPIIYLETNKIFAQKTTNSYKDKYALKMTTILIDQYGDIANSIFTGNYGSSGFYGGFPYSNKTDTFFGWYKYKPKPGDSASINITFYKNNNPIGGAGIKLSAATAYTKFKFGFNLPSSPDTAIITISSSGGTTLVISDTGSVLYIDAIQFKSSPLMINPFILKNAGEAEIFPNPAKDYINISYTPTDLTYYSVYDQLGKLVRTARITKKITTVSLAGLNKGIYFICLSDGKESINKKVIVQ